MTAGTEQSASIWRSCNLDASPAVPPSNGRTRQTRPRRELRGPDQQRISRAGSRRCGEGPLVNDPNVPVQPKVVWKVDIGGVRGKRGHQSLCTVTLFGVEWFRGWMWTEVFLKILFTPLELQPEQLGESPGREGGRVGADMKKHVLDIHQWVQRTSGIQTASNDGG